jgi:uncharacterized protein YndB with AHSA1/START domain
MKEKFHIEYVFETVSKRSLWNHLTTTQGLTLWFADDVDIRGNKYVFTWNKSDEIALVQYHKPETCIRFRWDEEEDEFAFFEFRLHTLELTGGVSLEITDFAENEEKFDAISLWDTQIEQLKRTLGVLFNENAHR